VNETPRLVEWQSKYADAGLQVLGVDTLFQDSRDAVDEFVAEYAVTYPVLVDDIGDVTKQWEARQLPRSFVVDREGIVRYIRIGELTEEDFQAQVVPLLDS
jgi:peroxiredoxin